MIDFSQIEAVATKGLLALCLGFMAQFALLTFFHKTRSVALVLIRTTLVQISALFAAGLLAQNWPFSFEKQLGPVFLPLTLIEGLIILWYLLWPRTTKF